MRGRGLSAALVGVFALLAVTPAASAEVVRDGGDTRGPLDLTRVKLGQHELGLPVKISTSGPLPRLKLLDPHPSRRAGEPARYLCLNLAAASIGRRLLCPAGSLKHGRIDVGVSRISGGRVRRTGSMSVPVKRGRRSISLNLKLRALGLRKGKLTFSAESSWYGPECEDGTGAEGRSASCRDRAPGRGEGRVLIRAVRRTGCSGFSSSTVSNGSRSRKEVALTFDDGPSEYTSQILRILAENDAHATFFVIGEQVPAYASTVRAIVDGGNEIANHSLQHESGPGDSSLRTTSSLIERATGFRPCMFRPPGGYLPTSTLAAARALQMVSVLWDVDTRDYQLPGSATIASRATDVWPGSIVLMHDGGGPRSQTVDALPGVIDKLRSRGFRLVTMTDLLGGHYRYSEVRGRVRGRLPEPAPYPLFRDGP